ncbi:MAG TPA: amino acid synthesis family protein [Solirubrobacteraceae bacterium]|nr:amino acid synthesis family protein [Solirubrobacteraceae bacterium]
MSLEIRKVVTYAEEIRRDGKPGESWLRKAGAAAVVRNPYAGRPYSEDLSEIVAPSAELGALLGARAVEALGRPAESYGKAALVGTGGEQEHAVAIKTSVFGDAFREAIGGATAWLPSISKRCAPGASADIPLCFKDEVWVRSHYDAVTMTIPDAPAHDEIVLLVAVASGARLHARLGGKTKEEALGAG